MRDRISEETGQALVRQLIKIRKEKGLSQYKVAKLSGLSNSGINSMETHKRIPNIVTCLKICRALDIQLWEVLKDLEK